MDVPTCHTFAAAVPLQLAWKWYFLLFSYATLLFLNGCHGRTKDRDTVVFLIESSPTRPRVQTAVILPIRSSTHCSMMQPLVVTSTSCVRIMWRRKEFSLMICLVSILGIKTRSSRIKGTRTRDPTPPGSFTFLGIGRTGQLGFSVHRICRACAGRERLTEHGSRSILGSQFPDEAFLLNRSFIITYTDLLLRHSSQCKEL